VTDDDLPSPLPPAVLKRLSEACDAVARRTSDLHTAEERLAALVVKYHSEGHRAADLAVAVGRSRSWVHQILKRR
jgi:hypothetical protein